MAVTMALSLLAATVNFGGITVDLLAPAVGLAILATLFWAGKLFFARLVSWKHSPMHWPVLAFTLYALVRYRFSPVEFDSRVELFQIVLYVVIYFLAACNFYHQRDRSWFLVFLVIVALLECLYGFWQFATRAETILHLQRPAVYHHRAGGTFICPNNFAGFLELVLGLIVAGVVVRRAGHGSVEQSALKKVFLTYAGLVVLAGIAFTLSRSGWLATAVGLFGFLLWGDWRSRAMWPRLIAAAVLAAAVTVVAFKVQPVRDYLAFTFTSSDKHDPNSLGDPTLGGRVWLWKASLKVAGEHPLFGSGPATWQWFHLKHRHPSVQFREENAHNDILNLLSDYGAVGFVLVLAALVCFFWHAVVLARSNHSSDQRAFAVGAMLSAAMLLIHSWFDFNLHIPSNALLLVTIMGMTAAMEDRRGRFARVTMTRGPRIALGAALVLICAAGVWFVGRAALAARYTSVGVDYKELLEWDTATNYFQCAIQLDPKNPDPHARMGDVYRTQSEWRRDPAKAAERQQLARQAIHAYERSLALNPFHTDVRLRLARTFEMAGDNDAALKAYQQALEFDPNNGFLHNRLGAFYRRIGDEERALEAYERAQKLNYWSGEANWINLEELRPPR
jgi:O-antigen ligase